MYLRGVNLGGWLVLERWITPSLFAGMDAEDEYTFSRLDAEDDYQRLRAHHETFITEADFAWLADHNIDAVRIPVGFWAFEHEPPYLQYGDLLDRAFAWASKYNMKVVLDLHGAPGSQNGEHHSGQAGRITWKRRSNVKRSLRIIEHICKQYGTHPALWGIELLNEPGWRIRPHILRSFYRKGYSIIREHCGDSVAVIINDIYRPLAWNNFMADQSFINLVYDLHLYQCFSLWDKALNMDGHLKKTHRSWDKLIRHVNRPVIVGEWSLGLDPKTFRDMDSMREKAALAAYAKAQMDTFSDTTGWFFWTYKTESGLGWNFRGCVETGIIATERPFQSS